MSTRFTRWLSRCAARPGTQLLAAVIPLGLIPAPAWGQDADPIVRVEEDWILLVYEPNGEVYSPQFHTVMSPVSDIESGPYAQVTWNYQELPDFTHGGFQVQSWNGDDNVEFKSIGTHELTNRAEIIYWTQSLSVETGQLEFQIKTGHSMTWGGFGGGHTAISIGTGVSNLNGYSPETSVANSWVTYGQNRVLMLTLRNVRYYSQSGVETTDSVSRSVLITGNPDYDFPDQPEEPQ